MPFDPKFTITSDIAHALTRIEGSRRAIQDLPMTPAVIMTLRETARLVSAHYSTMIEGNRLTKGQVVQVVHEKQHFPGRERDEKEVLGYYAALEKLEQLVSIGQKITEMQIQQLHALVMGEGRVRVKPTPYRDGQNVIRDSRSRKIVYMPPEARDVPILMHELTSWLAGGGQGVSCPIRAAIAHYEFATIHPYYDGNGRTARLLTTLILHLGGYDLKGLYALEEYYARNLGAYYEALTIGPSHNYYEGRAQADITSWIVYFCAGMAESFERVSFRAQDRTVRLKGLDPRQRKALELFVRQDMITSHDIAHLFNISERAARNILTTWVEVGFIKIMDAGKRSRKYALDERYEDLVA